MFKIHLTKLNRTYSHACLSLSQTHFISLSFFLTSTPIHIHPLLDQTIQARPSSHSSGSHTHYTKVYTFSHSFLYTLFQMNTNVFLHINELSKLPSPYLALTGSCILWLCLANTVPTLARCTFLSVSYPTFLSISKLDAPFCLHHIHTILSVSNPYQRIFLLPISYFYVCFYLHSASYERKSNLAFCFLVSLSFSSLFLSARVCYGRQMKKDLCLK